MMPKGLGLCALGLLLCGVAFTLHQINAERDAKKEDAVTPVAAEMDNTVEEHLKLDEEYHASCEDTVRVLKKCDETLKECLDILQNQAIILPARKEKK